MFSELLPSTGGVCGLKQIKRGERAEDTCAGTPRLRRGSDGWTAGLRLPALRQEGHLSEPYVLQRVLAYQHDTIQHDDNPMPMSSVQVELRVPRSLLLSMAAFEKQLLTLVLTERRSWIIS